MSRQQNIYFAKLAAKEGSYDEMTDYMEAVCKEGSELSAQERNLLSTAYKNAVGSRLSAWHMIVKAEQNGHPMNCDCNAGFAGQARETVEEELDKICSTISKLLDENLIAQASDGESKAFYHKMKADYYRYQTEYKQGDNKKRAAEEARLSYVRAQAVAEKCLIVTHPLRLGLALNYSVFQCEVLGNPGEACKTAWQAFEDALELLEDVSEDSYGETIVIIRLLRDNLMLLDN